MQLQQRGATADPHLWGFGHQGGSDEKGEGSDISPGGKKKWPSQSQVLDRSLHTVEPWVTERFIKKTILKWQVRTKYLLQ